MPAKGGPFRFDHSSYEFANGIQVGPKNQNLLGGLSLP